MDYSNRWPDPTIHYPPYPNPHPTDPYLSHYYNTQPPTISSSYYPPQPPLPNPNPIPSHHSYPSPSHTALPPPGAESYTPLTSYHHHHHHLPHYPSQPAPLSSPYAQVAAAAAAYYKDPPAAAAYYQDPAAGAYYQDPAAAAAGAVKEAIRQYGADPVAYPTVGSRAPNGMVPSVPPQPGPTFWKSPVQAPLRNGTKQGPKKRKIVQSAWCEVCKIDCTSKEVLDQHKLGKKHKKKLEESVIKAIPAAAQAVKKAVIGPQENPSAARGKSKKVALETVEELETKRRKVMEGGAAPEAVRVCKVCNVVCNSETVFNFHLAGQKHASLMKKREADGTVGPVAAA